MKPISSKETQFSKTDNNDVEDKLKMLLTKVNPANFAFNVVLENSQPVFLINKHEEESDIPPLIYPVKLEVNGVTLLIADLRSYIKAKSNDDNIDLLTMTPNIEQVKFIITNILMMDKMIGNENAFIHLTNGSVKGMTGWVSNIIKNAFSTNVLESLTIEVLLTLYFTRMFLGDDSADEDDVNDLVIHRTKSLMKGAEEFVGQVLSRHTPPKDIAELQTALQASSVKLNDVNIIGIVSLLNRGVLIPNAPYNIMMSLESIPSMVTLMWAFRTQRINNRAIFNITGKRIKELDELELFVKIAHEDGLV